MCSPHPTRVQDEKCIASSTVTTCTLVDFLAISANGGVHAGAISLAGSNVHVFIIPQPIVIRRNLLRSLRLSSACETCKHFSISTKLAEMVKMRSEGRMDGRQRGMVSGRSKNRSSSSGETDCARCLVMDGM